MNVPQNLAAIFNSPQLAELSLQAEQAGDMALRQFEAARRRDALRREHQVSGMAESDASASVDGREAEARDADGRRRIRRGARPAGPRPGAAPAGTGAAGGEEGPTAGPAAPGHVDLVA